MAKRKLKVGVHEYPRMQLRRGSWTNLNGKWDFALDPDAQWSHPRQVKFNRAIQVPFAPESPMSGVNETGFFKACWYRREVGLPKISRGQRLILHFGAVDYSARVWVNDQLAGEHEGGYTPFSLDITDLIGSKKSATLIVRAEDDPHDLAKPRGKQDWHLEPHGIWYYRTSGIWQTVWMEVVPETRIESIRWTPNLERYEIGFNAIISGPIHEQLRIRLRLRFRDQLILEDIYSITTNELERTISLPDPGIDDARNDILWWPWSPNLIDAEIELLNGDEIIDRVESYTAMRSVNLHGDRFVLNGRPMFLRLVLDQGYWPQSGLTAPDDDALKKDAELVKQLGFNGVRKHQKIEDPRFLYWADRLGLMVWEEMPSPYRFSPKSIERLTKQWTEAIERDASHPCIIAWVPFNESWGVPDLPDVKAQRDFVRGVYHLTKSLDPTRPVIGNDGWEMLVSDIIAVHDYDGVPSRIRERYQHSNCAHLFTHERPGNKQLLLDDCTYEGKPIMLTEFGGIAFSKDTKRTWGYRRAKTAQEFGRQYDELLTAVKSLPMLSGFCYTQFTDTYQEANGLLYMDRTPKVAFEKIAKATS